jgi:hypothetical protein
VRLTRVVGALGRSWLRRRRRCGCFVLVRLTTLVLLITLAGPMGCHERPNESGLQKFYTPDVAEIVYELYRRDFEAFGYERAYFEAEAAAGLSMDAE